MGELVLPRSEDTVTPESRRYHWLEDGRRIGHPSQVDEIGQLEPLGK
jgi:hypothetical protein